MKKVCENEKVWKNEKVCERTMCEKAMCGEKILFQDMF